MSSFLLNPLVKQSLANRILHDQTEPSQTSKMELFAITAAIFAKRSILGI